MRHPSRWLAGGLLALLAWATGPARAADDFLDADDAFRFSVGVADERTLELRYEVAPGYYLYREQFGFTSQEATLGVPDLPQGEIKYDVTFEKDVEAYRGTLVLRLPVEQARGPFRVTVRSQGCADQGLCYPPVEHEVAAELVAFGGVMDRADRLDAPGPGRSGSSLGRLLQGAAAPMGEAGGARPADTPVASHWLVVLAFGAAGLGLSFRPTVRAGLWPRDGQARSGRRPPGRFTLWLSHTLGLVVACTALGLVAGGLGAQAAGWGYAAILAVPLALATLALGVGFARRRDGATPAHRGEGPLAALVQGGLSVLRPPLAIPLVPGLLYVAATGQTTLGGLALLAFAAGVCLPQLVPARPQAGKA